MFISKKDLDTLENKLNTLIEDIKKEIELLKAEKTTLPRQKSKKVVD